MCNSDNPLKPVLSAIEVLCLRPENWNGYTSAPPLPAAVDQAARWISEFYGSICESNGCWLPPHISSDEEGNVVFEWGNRKKSLTIYVSPDTVEYIRTPGLSEEIEDGILDTQEDATQVWQWFVG